MRRSSPRHRNNRQQTRSQRSPLAAGQLAPTSRLTWQAWWRVRRRWRSMLFDPACDLVHDCFFHMASDGVRGWSGFLSIRCGHEEMAKARIEDELYVATPSQRVLPDLEIIARDLIV